MICGSLSGLVQLLVQLRQFQVYRGFSGIGTKQCTLKAFHSISRSTTKISACVALHTTAILLPPNFFVTRCLSLPQAYVIWAVAGEIKEGTRLEQCLPKSCSSLIIVEGILVHAQQLVSLAETIPRSVIFPVNVYRRRASWLCSSLTYHHLPTARRYASIAACEFFISTYS